MQRDVSFITKMLKPLFLQNEMTKIEDFEGYFDKNMSVDNVYFETQDGVKLGCWVLKPSQINNETECILVMHSNGCNRKQFTENFGFKRLLLHNYILVIPDYRSFGDSKGDFWVDTVNYDIEATHKYCKDEFKKEPHFLGYSLGGAIALEYLRYSKHNNKIVIISTFSSTLDILNTVNLWKLVSFAIPYAEQTVLNEFNFDSCENIKQANKDSVLILHGSDDEMIPCSQGKKLASVVSCKFIEMQDHDHFTVFRDGTIFMLINNFLRNNNKNCIN